jgi:hypothetical protein
MGPEFLRVGIKPGENPSDFLSHFKTCIGLYWVPGLGFAKQFSSLNVLNCMCVCKALQRRVICMYVINTKL